MLNRRNIVILFIVTPVSVALIVYGLMVLFTDEVSRSLIIAISPFVSLFIGLYVGEKFPIIDDGEFDDFG